MKTDELESSPAPAGWGRIVVGDRYKERGNTIEIVEVKDGAVAYVHTDALGRVDGYALTLEDFVRLEDATLRNGAEFVPAPNAFDEATEPAPDGSRKHQ